MDMTVYEIRYRLGAGDLEAKLLEFIEEQRIIKKANGGDIDDIRLVTGMRVVHYGGIDYSEGKEMGLTPEEDIIDVVVMLSQVHTFYAPKEKPGFTVIQMSSMKYMIEVPFYVMMELTRLLKSSARQFAFAEKIDEDLRNNGSIPKKD